MTALLCGCYTGSSVDNADPFDPGHESESDAPGTGDSGIDTDSGIDSAGLEECPLEPRRIWKLTPDQVSRTVASMIPAITDAGDVLRASLPQEGTFTNDADLLAMTEPHVSELLRFSNRLADEAIANPGALHDCLAQTREQACVESFVRAFATKGYRRPIREDELADLLALYDAELVRGEDSALHQVVRAVFMSPYFHYRTELGVEVGDGVFALDDDERANALSYLLTDGPPDDSLLQAASEGRLRTSEGLREVVEQMLEDPASGSGVVRMLREHLRATELGSLTKDQTILPEFSRDLAEAMERESVAFLEHALWSDDGRWKTILTAPYSIIDPVLAPLYGLDAGVVDAASLVDLPPERAGVMTQPGMMAMLARPDETDPVGRGKFVREVLLCQTIPPPPPDVDTLAPDVEDLPTKREQLAKHREDPTCATCHDLLDGPGLAFEHFDAIGRFRTQENGAPIDGSGSLNPNAVAGFDNAAEMMELIARDERARGCVADAVANYVSGHVASGAGECDRRLARTSAETSDTQIREIWAALLGDERFVLRGGE